MSRRLTAFKMANIMPQVSCNYAISIPSISRSLIAVESATLPFKKTTSQPVYIRGIQYQIPVKQTAQGVWSCTMPENLFMGSLYQSLSKYYNDVDGNLWSMNKVYSSSLLGTNTVKTFGLKNIYIFILDALTSKAPVAACVLEDCYLMEIKDLNLNASGANDIMKVTLTFQYNNILDPLYVVDDVLGVNAGLLDGTEESAFAMEAGVAAVTAATWSKNMINKGIDEILNYIAK